MIAAVDGLRESRSSFDTSVRDGAAAAAAENRCDGHLTKEQRNFNENERTQVRTSLALTKGMGWKKNEWKQWGVDRKENGSNWMVNW